MSKIIVGLGNPGPKYETTRHNVGFLAVDHLIDIWKARGPSTKNEAEVYQASVAGESVYLLKPQTYMNLSGRAVAPFFQFYHCASDDLIVIHDDLDLDPGSLRIKTGGGTGGHNGLKSLDVSLGKEQLNYHRIRLGIGRPGKEPFIDLSRMSPADFVLQPFTDLELRNLPPLFDDLSRACEMMIRGEISQAMNLFNRREKKELE